jgi:hypothetical protein
VTGTLTNPGIGSLDPSDPILRYVDLTTTHIAEARELELPAWARAVIPGPSGSPLLYAGQLAGRPAAVLAFEPRRSDLPLQVAFPVLLANLGGELLGGSETPVDAIVPGSPVTLAIPAGAVGVRVERPDGTVDELVAPTTDATTVTFARTELLGVYTVTGTPNPDATPGASSSPSSSPPSSSPPSSSASSPGPGASPAFAPAAPGGPTRFAVALLDVNESTIAPGDISKLTALGEPGTSPGTSPGTAGGAVPERPNARDELWIPVVLVALIVLTVEWLVYERDTLARLRRAVTGRIRGSRPAGRGA